MPRPCKCRRVAFAPEVTYFKPAGVPLSSLEEVQISVEELEAIRLKDLEGLEQEECAVKMNISRPTFQRVLGSARRKIAEALLEGKAMRIGGGNFEMSPLSYRCAVGHEWELPYSTEIATAESCPICNTSDVLPLQPISIGKGQGGGRRCQRGRTR